MGKALKQDYFQHKLKELLLTKRNTITIGAITLFLFISLVTLSFLQPYNNRNIAKSITDLTTGSPYLSPKPKNLDNSKNKVSTYVVVEGDDFWKIGEKLYGSGFNGNDIIQYNNIGNPDDLKVGQVLLIPSIAPKAPTTGEISSIATDKAQTGTRSYTVLPGQGLSQIALLIYGDINMWSSIAKLNNINSPYTIEPGVILKLP